MITCIPRLDDKQVLTITCLAMSGDTLATFSGDELAGKNVDGLRHMLERQHPPERGVMYDLVDEHAQRWRGKSMLSDLPICNALWEDLVEQIRKTLGIVLQRDDQLHPPPKEENPFSSASHIPKLYVNVTLRMREQATAKYSPDDFFAEFGLTSP